MPMRPERFGCQGGATLVEVVIAIVVLGVGIATLLSVGLLTTRHSADPMIAQQANAVARSYLEEALLHNFCDPDFSTDCPSACTANACTTCVAGGAETRPNFDDVCDYQGLADTSGAVDQNGNPVTGLEAFNVTMGVDDNPGLNGLQGALGQVVRVDVRVTHDTLTDIDVRLSAYKANY